MDNNKQIENYILNHIIPEENVLQDLFRETHVHIYHPRMVSGHLEGKLLYMICKMLNPENILEIGTYTGYSAISMAYALNDTAKIHTIEINDELYDFSNSFIKKAGVENKIIQYTGSALKIIPELEIEFDLVFIDGDKKEYPEYYNLVIDKLKKGGVILADNTLWGGKVVQSNLRANDYDTQGIIRFNTIIKEDSRVEQIMLPVRDGVSIIRKK